MSTTNGDNKSLRKPWSPKVQALIELLADPSDLRSLTEKAAEVGITRVWASRIQNDPEVDALVTMNRRAALRGRLNRVYAKLEEKVEQGGRDCVNAARLILQSTGDIQTGLNVITNVTQVNVSDDDREKRIAQVRANRLAALKG